MNLAPEIARIGANGYELRETSVTHSSSGSVAREFEIVGLHPLLNANGTRRDYVPARNLASVTFTYMSSAWPEAFSPVAAGFADAVAAALKSTGAPLIRRTGRSIQFLYRTDAIGARLSIADPHARTLFQHGLVACDERSVLMLAAGTPDIPLGGDAVWVAKRSPITVAREVLPLWDEDAASAALSALVDKWCAAGDLNVCGPYLEHRAAPSTSLSQGSMP